MNIDFSTACIACFHSGFVQNIWGIDLWTHFSHTDPNLLGFVLIYVHHIEQESQSVSEKYSQHCRFLQTGFTSLHHLQWFLRVELCPQTRSTSQLQILSSSCRAALCPAGPPAPGSAAWGSTSHLPDRKWRKPNYKHDVNTGLCVWAQSAPRSHPYLFNFCTQTLNTGRGNKRLLKTRLHVERLPRAALRTSSHDALTCKSTDRSD